MSEITAQEKQKLESLLKMKQGYLLNFTDAALQAFVFKSVGLDIRSEKYHRGTGSKANRMRELWAQEPNLLVAKLLFDLCQYYQDFKQKKGELLSPEEQALYTACIAISKRLANSVEVVALLLKKKGPGIPIFVPGMEEGAAWEKTLPNLLPGYATDKPQPDAENETVFLVTSENIMPFLMSMR
ncbi:hypothetical protein ACFSC6_16825 [Rufibacter sediminis]|uniref:Uncharacterized protein n=1 Tax=Rufibacter sediminis TaxID=2762756 RepID=A0ABR6VSD7_9BACT|nr:hypothetical protein [Rufibacter sediminis]MBC3540121.1 hypothetical protein [Rufibacter sediminis]